MINKMFFSFLALSIAFFVSCDNSGGSSSKKIRTIADVGGEPDGVTITESGNIYYTDIESGDIVQINTDGTMTVIADSSDFAHPDGITAITSGGLDIIYVTDTGSSAVDHTANTDGTVGKITVPSTGIPDAGSITVDSDIFDGAGVLDNPSGITMDSAGNLYVVDQNGSPDPTVYQIQDDGAGGYTANELAGIPAELSDPHGIALQDVSGTSSILYVTDQGTNTIVKITISDTEAVTDPANIVTSVIGQESSGSFEDGSSSEAMFKKPHGIGVDSKGTVFVSDENNNRIRMITPSGNVITFAGTGKAGDRDGDVEDSNIYGPRGLAVGRNDEILICDTVNGKVKVIE